MYTNYSNKSKSYPVVDSYAYPYSSNDDRFFFAPFLFGGLAGTALGYGLASNQMNNQVAYYPVYPVYQTYPTYGPYPTTYSTSNNYYY